MIANRTRAGALAAGAGLAVACVLMVLATAALGGRPALPLFDGFAPPPDYDWVNPPPGLPRANKAPAGATVQVPLSGGGSAAASVATSDGQAGVTLDAGAVAAHPPDTGVRVTFTPLDRATLGLLPPGLRPESNAYKVTLTYVPSGSPVVAMNGFGTIALTAAGPASALVSSCDGVTRAGTAAGPFGDSHGRLAGLADPGY